MIERAPLDAEGHVDLHQALRALSVARDHPRVQRRRTVVAAPPHCARPRRRGRAHYGRQAARPAGRVRARPRGPLGAARRIALLSGRDAGLRTGHDAALAAGGRTRERSSLFRTLPPLVRSIRLDFLGRWLFLVKTFDFGGWICLDFLGFSRPNRDFSMSYTDKTTKIFSRHLFGVRSAIGGPKPCQTSWIVHGSSVIQFPIFRKKLLPEEAPLFF